MTNTTEKTPSHRVSFDNFFDDMSFADYKKIINELGHEMYKLPNSILALK